MTKPKRSSLSPREKQARDQKERSRGDYDPYRLQRVAERKAAKAARMVPTVSRIKVGGKMSFVGKDREMAPTFSVWWRGLCDKLGVIVGQPLNGNPPPNIEAAYSAYATNSSISAYLERLDRERFNGLIAKSSIGAGLADIKARGADAHAADLAREMKPLFKSRVEREDHDRLTTARALEVSRKALIERCRDAARRLDRDLADLREDLDRLQNFD